MEELAKCSLSYTLSLTCREGVTPEAGRGEDETEAVEAVEV